MALATRGFGASTRNRRFSACTHDQRGLTRPVSDWHNS